MDSYCQVTLGFKERLAPEDFLGCLAFLDPQDLLVPRETEESRETGARLEWGWKVRWVLRDLTDCRVLQVLESQVSRGCGVLLASKVGESVRVPHGVTPSRSCRSGRSPRCHWTAGTLPGPETLSQLQEEEKEKEEEKYYQMTEIDDGTLSN